MQRRAYAVLGGLVLCFYFRDVVPFYDLGGEVFETERCRERGADAAQVRPERVSLQCLLAIAEKRCTMMTMARQGNVGQTGVVAGW